MNWHQKRAMARNPSAYLPNPSVYTLITESDMGQSRMIFGANREAAFSSLQAHRINHPQASHFLCYQGKVIA